MQYNPTESHWYLETYFYILDINGLVKFGITSNWERRIIAYKKEVGDVPFKIIKKEVFDTRWKAELIEQIIKWRLRKWCVDGRHEWINAPIIIVLNCYLDTKERIVPEIKTYYNIHLKGNDRWGYYKHIVDMTFDKDEN